MPRAAASVSGASKPRSRRAHTRRRCLAWPIACWRLKYTPDDENLVDGFYIPALECAVRYDRLTGYFGATALALAMRGIEGLVRNGGHMRLIVGCTLDQAEVDAIARGTKLRDAVERHLAVRPLEPPDQPTRDALELLAWMIEHGVLDVKVAVPCDADRQPMSADGIFHEKSGIIEDASETVSPSTGRSTRRSPAGRRIGRASTSSPVGPARRITRRAKRKTSPRSGPTRRSASARSMCQTPREPICFDSCPSRTCRRGSPCTMRSTCPGRSQALPPATGPDLRQQVWRYIKRAPTLPDGGALVGEATCAVRPWPHQIHAFERLYASPAPRLLIADEVGLGKTIQAGMLLRQMWLAGRARRILILTPAAVMRQWQLELREKFNLNWPVYDDGSLNWCPSPAMAGSERQAVSASTWHRQDIVIASSHLMRRRDREKALCKDAEPWDLIVLDEAHHARRRGAGRL